MNKLVLHNVKNDNVIRAYEVSTGKWWGCNWPTKFGPMQLQLEDVWARQARLVAKATSGKESEAWYAAERHLSLIEADAVSAEKMALKAIEATANQQWAEALEFAEAAVALESKYRTSETWRPLLEAIRSEWGQDTGQSEDE